MEGTLKNITSTSLPKMRSWSESLLCMSADSPASAATHLQWLRDPPHCFSLCSRQVWVLLPGDLLRREIRREWGAGMNSPSVCVCDRQNELLYNGSVMSLEAGLLFIWGFSLLIDPGTQLCLK